MRVTKDQILLAIFQCLRLPVVSVILRYRRIEMESPSKSSSKSHRVRDFLPTVKPSYLSLILVLVCATNFMRNESTNDRLLELEKQMKILSASKSRVETGSPLNYDEISAKPFADSVRAVRKTAESLEKKPFFSSGKNHSFLKVINLDCSRTASNELH